MNIIGAISDINLLGASIRDQKSFAPWSAFLAAAFGLPLSPDQEATYRLCTARTTRPAAPFKKIFLVCGRRAGKSFTSALIACFMACFKDWRPFMSPGERCIVLLVAGDKEQAKILHRYCLGILQAAPILGNRIISYTASSIDLQGAVTIEVVTRNFRAVRGRTVGVALLDEIAFWRADEESANPDKAVIAAIKPMLATFGDHGLLIAASSPYDKHGVLWEAHRKYFGQDDADTLVWQSATRQMNPTVEQSFIDREVLEGGVAAESEYYAWFRSDRDRYVDPAVVEECVIEGRHELAPDPRSYRYHGFVDPSGGQQDSFALGIAHAEGTTIVLDCLREIRPPLSPQSAVREFAKVLRSYGLGQCKGDAYSGQFVRELFADEGVTYIVSRQSKSEFYLEFLGALNSRRVELLDDKKMVKQLCQLERRTGRGTGRDIVDHPKGNSYHDDCINAAAGAMVMTASAPAPFVAACPIIVEQDRSSGNYPGGPTYGPMEGSTLMPGLSHGPEYGYSDSPLDAGLSWLSHAKRKGLI